VKSLSLSLSLDRSVTHTSRAANRNPGVRCENTHEHTDASTSTRRLLAALAGLVTVSAKHKTHIRTHDT